MASEPGDQNLELKHATWALIEYANLSTVWAPIRNPVIVVNYSAVISSQLVLFSWDPFRFNTDAIIHAHSKNG